VAVDQAGNALGTGAPGSPGAPWSLASIDPGQALTSVSCPSTTLCVAVDGVGQVLATHQPLGGGWSGLSIDAGKRLSGVSCASESLCVAVDTAGNALVSSNPGSPLPSWTASSIDPGNALQGISCAASACVAVDGAGNVLASGNPAAAGTWRRRPADPALALTAVSCTSSPSCLGVDASGNAIASGDPVASAPTWSSTPIDGRPGGLTGVSCASSGLCVAVGGHGEAMASDNPTAPVPGWSESTADPGEAIAGVACLPSGMCAAVDAHGHVVIARVPPPTTLTAEPAEVTATTATLSGLVDPNDATLLRCWFEYGTSGGYGQSAPCATLPLPSGGLQAVIAPISGLGPNTTYHYRLVASSASGTESTGDATFTTAVSSTVPLVTPHPSISGTPAVGQRLTCHSGVPSGSTAQLSYAWLRDLVSIPGATGSGYSVKAADTGHHLQCQVTARNAGGSATVRSAFVTVPVQGVLASVGETSVGRARVRGARVGVGLACSPRAGGGCQIALRMTVLETLRAGRVVALAARGRATRETARAGAVRRVRVSIGSARVHLGAGQRLTVSLGLNTTGRRLLKARHRLPLLLTVSGTVIGVIQSVLSEQALEIRAATRGAGGHR
jgi:hypothetical protein